MLVELTEDSNFNAEYMSIHKDKSPSERASPKMHVADASLQTEEGEKLGSVLGDI